MTKKCELRLRQLAERFDIERIGLYVDYKAPARITWLDTFTLESGDLCMLGSGVHTVKAVVACLSDLRKEFAHDNWFGQINERLARRARYAAYNRKAA